MMASISFQAVKIFVLIPLLFICLISPVMGQESIEEGAKYSEGSISEALHASMIPDNKTVGVYLTVGWQNELSPQQWASTVEKYFTAYGFPVKIILDRERPEGKATFALIYIGAKAYVGNLSSRDISLYKLLTEHEEVFTDLLDMYKEANPELFDHGN